MKTIRSRFQSSGPAPGAGHSAHSFPPLPAEPFLCAAAVGAAFAKRSRPVSAALAEIGHSHCQSSHWTISLSREHNRLLWTRMGSSGLPFSSP